MPTHIPFFQVNAFTDRRFGGNPAAVCPLPGWLPDEVMQRIAAEQNLSETVYFVKDGDGYRIRWFTPACEVSLCGHGTLAAAFVVARFMEPQRPGVTFFSRSGPLPVARDGERFILDFPAGRLHACTLEAWPLPDLPCTERYHSPGDAGGTYVAVMASAGAVRDFKPDFPALMRTNADLIITARGETCDFVSRVFAPWAGIPEDPVTGSIHTLLVPYWAQRLGKRSLAAKQVSARGGELSCEDRGERVAIGGNAVLAIGGTLQLFG